MRSCVHAQWTNVYGLWSKMPSVEREKKIESIYYNSSPARWNTHNKTKKLFFISDSLLGCSCATNIKFFTLKKQIIIKLNWLINNLTLAGTGVQNPAQCALRVTIWSFTFWWSAQMWSVVGTNTHKLQHADTRTLINTRRYTDACLLSYVASNQYIRSTHTCAIRECRYSYNDRMHQAEEYGGRSFNEFTLKSCFRQ